MNLAQTMAASAQSINNSKNVSREKRTMSFEQQIETLKKLKELVDAGILTEAEFDFKKKEIWGL